MANMVINGVQYRTQSYHIALYVFALWGFGVSVGRYFPKAQPPDSLAIKITSICSNYQPVQGSPLCQTIFAANFTDEDWREDPLGRVSQEKLDAEFLNFVAFQVPTAEGNDPNTQLGVQCMPSTQSFSDLTDCCNRTKVYLKNETQQAIQDRYAASRRSVDPPKKSTFSRIVPVLATAGSWAWKLTFCSFAAVLAGTLLNTRLLFWIWVCTPWIWFFRLAPSSYILIWYSLASFAYADVSHGAKYPISHTWLTIAMCALFVVLQIWYWIKTSREIQFSLFCFLAFTVPLEPLVSRYFPSVLRGFIEGLQKTPQAQAAT